MTADAYDLSVEDSEQRIEVYEYTRHVLGEELVDLCELRFASSGERRQKSSQKYPAKFYMDDYLKSEDLTKQSESTKMFETSAKVDSKVDNN